MKRGRRKQAKRQSRNARAAYAALEKLYGRTFDLSKHIERRLLAAMTQMFDPKPIIRASADGAPGFMRPIDHKGQPVNSAEWLLRDDQLLAIQRWASTATEPITIVHRLPKSL